MREMPHLRGGYAGCEDHGGVVFDDHKSHLLLP